MIADVAPMLAYVESKVIKFYWMEHHVKADKFTFLSYTMIYSVIRPTKCAFQKFKEWSKFIFF